MNWKHYVFIGLLTIGLLSSIIKCVRAENNVKEIVNTANNIKKQQSIKIDSLKASNDSIVKKQVFLSDSIEALNKGYRKLLSITQDIKVSDSLQKEEIRKGKLRFGPMPVKQYQSVLASAYGNNAFDVLNITEMRLENQMKVSENYYGITVHQDTIINTQEIAIKELSKMAKPNFWQRLKDWIVGILIGGGGVLLLL